MQDDLPQGPSAEPEEQQSKSPGPLFKDPGFEAVMLLILAGFITTWCLESIGLALHSRSLVNLSRLLADFGVADSRIFRGEVWRLVTNLFMHAGFEHLLGNLVVMVPLTAMVRSWTKGYWWLGVFLLTGMAGTLLQVAVHPKLAVVGASGGIAGLAGVALVCGWRLLKSGQGRALVLPGLVVVAALVYLQVVGELSGQEQNVAHMAHLGGFVAGLLLGRRLPLRLS